MRGKYQTGKIQQVSFGNSKNLLSKFLGNLGRTSDPMGQTREMGTWPKNVQV